MIFGCWGCQHSKQKRTADPNPPSSSAVQPFCHEASFALLYSWGLPWGES